MAINFQFVKNTVSVKCNETRSACICKFTFEVYLPLQYIGSLNQYLSSTSLCPALFLVSGGSVTKGPDFLGKVLGVGKGQMICEHRAGQ